MSSRRDVRLQYRGDGLRYLSAKLTPTGGSDVGDDGEDDAAGSRCADGGGVAASSARAATPSDYATQAEAQRAAEGR